MRGMSKQDERPAYQIIIEVLASKGLTYSQAEEALDKTKWALLAFKRGFDLTTNAPKLADILKAEPAKSPNFP